MIDLNINSLKKIIQQESIDKVFFDLDSTVYDVSGRQVKIFNEFANSEINIQKFPHECYFLKKITRSNMQYYPEDCLRNVGLDKIDPDFKNTFFDFWAERFFSNEYLKYDEIEPGFLDFFEFLLSINSKIYFLTGRDVPRMLKGTKEQLQASGLFKKNCDLVMKPDSKLKDDVFKLDVVLSICNKNEKIVFIDNEAESVNLIFMNASNSLCVFYDSIHSERSKPLDELFCLKSFK